jgi:hypothetical protein
VSRSPLWQKVPILVVFGDHRDTPTGLPTLPTWQARFEACEALIGRIKSADGQAGRMNPFTVMLAAMDLHTVQSEQQAPPSNRQQGTPDLESGLTREQIAEALTIFPCTPAGPGRPNRWWQSRGHSANSRAPAAA